MTYKSLKELNHERKMELVNKINNFIKESNESEDSTNIINFTNQCKKLNLIITPKGKLQSKVYVRENYNNLITLSLLIDNITKN